MAKTSVLKQIPVYTSKNFRLFKNQKDWKFILISVLVSLIVSVIIKKNMFVNYDDTKSGFFAMVSAAIWIGLFNSVQSVCREHDTITSEYRSGLHISSYISARILFDLCLCLVQSVIMLVICNIFIDFPSAGLVSGHSAGDYFVTLFLIIWCSDIMGVMISSVVSSANAAMTIMLFVLILQLVMSGVLFELSNFNDMVANITFSKWGMSAMGTIGNLNDENLPFKISEVFPNVVRFEQEEAYEYTKYNLIHSWEVIGLIGLCSAVISVVSIKIRNRGT